MIISVLTRKTRLKDEPAWRAALEPVLPRIREVLEREPGFASVEYYWGVDEAGLTAQITTWESEQACKDYIRGGGAASVATIEEAAVPTAPYPDGAWVRKNFVTAK
jgi:hypothetical protein